MTDRRTLVINWLQRQGYSLEYFAARELRLARFHVRRGVFYQDPDTHDNREIDLVASALSEDPLVHGARLEIVLTVECKHSDPSWVVMTDQRPKGTVILGGDVTDRAARYAIDRAFRSPVTGYMVATAITLDPHGGKPESTKDIAYEALQQALKAALSMVGPFSDRYRVVLPVVLTDTHLFALSYPETGTEPVETVTEVQRSQLVITSPSAAHPLPLDVVTRSDFAQYLVDLRDELDQIAQETSSARRRMDQAKR